MIVRSIKVVDWRCFVGEIAVGPFGDGLNVIYAPNTTGKSTLFEAMRRGLLDGHKVTGKDVEAIRAWGRSLAPKVAVEFVHGGQEYRITKQFLDGPSALLERKERGRYERLAEGTAADEKAREMLTKNPPGRGLSRQENWGLAQVLWAPQGNLAVGPLSRDLVSDIRAMLSAQVSGAGTGPVEKRIEEQYLTFFTGKGKLRTGKDAPRLVHLEGDLAEALAERAKAHERYLVFETLSRRVEELRARRGQTRREAEETMKVLQKARLEAEEYRNLLGERAQQAQRVATVQAQYQALKQRVELIRSTTAEWQQARSALSALESEAPLKHREVEGRERDAARRKAELEDARKGRAAVDRADELAKAALRFNECSRELRRLRELIAGIETAERSLNDWRGRRNSFLAPDPKTLRGLLKAVKDRDEAQVRIEASLIHLEIVPEKDGSAEVLTGENPGSVLLSAGAPTEVRGSPEVAVDLPGIARLRTWGPAGSIAEHRKARSRAEEKIRELSEPFGTSDPDSLESLADQAKALDAKVAEAETQVQTLLAGHSLDELIQERQGLEVTIRGFLDLHPEWVESPPQAERLLAGAEDARQAFISAVEAAETSWEKAQGALTAACGQRETWHRRTEDARRAVTVLEKRLADLSGDGQSDQERDKELQRLAMSWDAAQAALAGIEGRLAPYTYDPKGVVEKLERQMEAVARDSERAREEELRQEAGLESLSLEGPYSALTRAEERVARLEEDVRQERMRVEAIRLLYETVAACRAEAILAVSRPVQDGATRILKRIAGPRLGRIQVGEAFEPSGVVPESLEEPVSLDNLSGGEQEQLYLATRLALAEVLAKDERQLVVLDDVLTATDTGRAARVMNLLEETAERLQMLILTCHPERYLGLKTARFFDLENMGTSLNNSIS